MTYRVIVNFAVILEKVANESDFTTLCRKSSAVVPKKILVFCLRL